jgi:hypothetical protein
MIDSKIFDIDLIGFQNATKGFRIERPSYCFYFEGLRGDKGLRLEAISI